MNKRKRSQACAEERLYGVIVHYYAGGLILTGPGRYAPLLFSAFFSPHDRVSAVHASRECVCVCVCLHRWLPSGVTS